MNSHVTQACRCGSIGAPKDIRFCEEHHRYWLGDSELASVSKVIKAVLPTDYSKVDAAVLEHARIRGERVDRYFSEYLRTGTVQVLPGEWKDVVERLSKLIPWWDTSGLQALAVQEIVFSEEDGIAGMLDIRILDGVIDLKVVSELQPAYALQLGAYLDYAGVNGAAILHASSNGVRLVNYDVRQCWQWWRSCVTWWKAMQEINEKRSA